jgi:rhodanese-related sulfurtransferase
MSHSRIHPLDLLTNASPDICVLDVRTAAEVSAKSLPGCLHIPLHELTPEGLEKAIKNSGKDGSCVYLLCQGGKRAEIAAGQLAGKLSGKLCVIDGGIQAVEAAQIPLQASTKKSMSIERQVRIAAGALVVIGVILGTWVNTGFYGLSAFVGAGLVFAGVTDTCAMGIVISRMPWNR